MKRVLCLVLALICVLSMTCCGKSDEAPATNTTAADTQPTTQPTTPTTQPATPETEPATPEIQPTTPTEPATTPAEPPVKPAKPVNKDAWKDDGVLKILTIGNSFSTDCMQYVYDVAEAAGVKNIKLGNLYISGCSLNKHLTNLKEDKADYTYYTNDDGAWTSEKNYKLADAVKAENWDFISFQQSSSRSGIEKYYSDIQTIVPMVEALCTNENVEFIWHMTWAYKQDTTNSSFSSYNNDQMTMYNMIIGAVQQHIVPYEKITRIVPNGTAIQNARTSYVGDELTRDGYHLSKQEGRLIAAVAMVATSIGIDYDTIDLTGIYDDEKFDKMALESVKNALEKPFEVTKSQYTK